MNHLFTWIPKTAGTSLFKAMQTKYGMKLLLEHNFRDFDNQGSVSFGHLELGLLLEMQVIKKEYWDSANKFAVVRNPYDRFISLYFDFLRTSRIQPTCTPIQFAKACLHSERRPGLYNTFGFSQCSAQRKWIRIGVEIYRYEQLGELQTKLDISLPHENQGQYSKFGSFEKHYDHELYQIVTELYYDDLVVLGYEVRA